MSVLDASAVLAFLQREPGAQVVREHLEAGAHMSAVNWSEVAQKTRARGASWPLVAQTLLSFGLAVHPATIEDADGAAARWRPGEGLSLGDRFCLALADRLGVDAITADAAWGDASGVQQIR
ncbi:type II toxin-antitoxin system VapC family toxin [Cellulomonas phragmiteti]|uniref:PIN domain-containing protein n=1 Tax=Cellulomonas phragmiteti TaxID=478780 RepID=A0ABQ4DHD2_9CELL|nr:type II toxin-antitoxin system VapC family toxin [Cellulomonas phragmiteti]GIG38750.1 hypothetical protein Cph01nite_05120 [Cellulomonas phragmiteti]